MDVPIIWHVILTQMQPRMMALVAIPTGCDSCSGEGSIVDNDADNDGVCNDEAGGCTRPNADNYNPQAFEDDGCTMEKIM